MRNLGRQLTMKFSCAILAMNIVNHNTQASEASLAVNNYGAIPISTVLPATLSYSSVGKKLEIKDNGRIAIIGAGMASRMMKYSEFETELHLRYPEKRLTIRNIADEGNTPVFRPHPGRSSQLAFEGAEEYYDNYETGKSGPWTKGAKGSFETPDQWLERIKPDTIIAFFGYNSALAEGANIEYYKKEFTAFLDHTLAQKYNGEEVPQLAIVSPTAIQDLSAKYNTPDGSVRNPKLEKYTQAMSEICKSKGVMFVDTFTPSKTHFESTKEELSVDGALLNRKGYQWLSPVIADALYGAKEKQKKHTELVHRAVEEKNWMWHNLYKIPNGVHVYGRRHTPHGPKNYPDELKKLAEMTGLRDYAIWRALDGRYSDLGKADAKTHKLTEIESNYRKSKKNGNEKYLSGRDTIKHLEIPDGYKIELFADEKRFPELANPCQMSFDNKGRLWVGCMPSYPHWRPGDAKPTDRLIILEDTNNDGRADKRTVFADDLHLCIGFELAAEGVYVSQADSLILLTDTDGDDKYDVKEYLASGFDDHDTHHAFSAFTTDPSGAIMMGEGVFLISHVETVYGTHRGTNGGFFRYNPKRRHLERTAQLQIPNPWGTVYDKWGQPFFLHTSDPRVNWMTPGTVKSRYGFAMHASKDLVEKKHKVRPTSGLELMSSRHFPDDVQGDLMLGNTINFLGIKQHELLEDGTGYRLKHRQDLLVSSEGNFRPCDLEIAPDGSLYLLDWSNILIGHMQHNARDPKRDHQHGRVYRITYPSRPLLKPAKIDGASIPVLLNNLKAYEDRTRYRTRRELRGRDTKEVLSELERWVASLDKSEKDYERYLLEAMWVSWGHDQIDQDLVRQLLKSEDYKVRSAAVNAVRYNGHQMSDHVELLKVAAADENGRVRVGALAAGSWLTKTDGLEVLEIAKSSGVDDWMEQTIEYTEATLNSKNVEQVEEVLKVPSHLKGLAKTLFVKGSEIYHRDAHCATCHQEDGNGLEAGGFPPLDNTKWVLGDSDRLIKLTLKGLSGEMEVKGKKYNGLMTSFEGILNDEEVAAVLTFVRNSFGNKANAIEPEQVKRVRAEVKGAPSYMPAADLLKQHPHN